MSTQALTTLALAAAGAAFPAIAASAPSGSELKRINTQIEQTRKEIEKYRGQEKILTEDMRGLEASSREAKTKVHAFQSGLRRAQDRLGELHSRLETLRSASGSTQGLLGQELRQYALRRFSQDDFFSGTDLWREALSRGAILQKAAWLKRLRGLGASTEKATSEARFRASALMAQSKQALVAREKLELKVQEKKEALTHTHQNLEAAAVRQAELEESARALTKLIAQAAGSRERRAPRTHGRGAQLNIPRHSLAWPARGDVAEFFGRQKNAELNTWIIRQGIRLKTPLDAPVTPVSPGQVIFAGPFRSYGQVVIVDHGSGFVSVYGELGKIFKSSGDKVSARQTLGQAGKGRGREGVLYLELRHGSMAIDPLVWLKEKP